MPAWPKRTDAYGGSLENRVRFSLEILEAMISVWGPGRVGICVSPSGQEGNISDSNPEATFGYFAARLNEYELAYLHIIEPRIKGTEEHVAATTLRKTFRGPIIENDYLDFPFAT